jgi:DNA recombination protein RmuC
MNSFLLFLTGVFSGIFAGFFLTKSFWKTNREAELNIKLKSQEKLENDLKTQFEILSSRMLKESREELIKATKANVSEPFNQQVDKLAKQVKTLNDESREKLSVLSTTTKDLKTKNEDVESAAKELANALRNPNIKGRWGEVTLRRTMEYVGLNRYCDFDEQVTLITNDGTYRPDCVITIPGERLFIIDSKAPLDSYQDALKAKDERTYKLALDNHVKKVQGHINELSKKKYSNNKTNKGVVLDGVIMFIPIEGALAMALAHDEKLLEYAFDKKIILTFPTSFLAILQNLSMNIEQANLTRGIQEASNKAGELNNALEAFLKRFNDIGLKIKQTASIYNEAHNKLKTTIKKGEQFAELTAKKTSLSLSEEISENKIKQFDI